MGRRPEMLVPGKAVIVKTKLEDEDIVKWANAQTNRSDSIRYLIQMDIAKNGIRNYAPLIPSERSQEYLQNQIMQEYEEAVKEAVKMGLVSNSAPEDITSTTTTSNVMKAGSAPKGAEPAIPEVSAFEPSTTARSIPAPVPEQVVIQEEANAVSVATNGSVPDEVQAKVEDDKETKSLEEQKRKEEQKLKNSQRMNSSAAYW